MLQHLLLSRTREIEQNNDTYMYLNHLSIILESEDVRIVNYKFSSKILCIDESDDEGGFFVIEWQVDISRGRELRESNLAKRANRIRLMLRHMTQFPFLQRAI